MSTRSPLVQHAGDTMETNPHTAFDSHHGLEPEFYTAEKLRYASAKHVHVTSRRFFIGPIPKGWLQNHRKSWYKTRLRVKNYSSKAVTFRAETNLAQYTEGQDRFGLSPEQTKDDEPEGTTEGEQEEDSTEQEDAALRTLSEPLGEATKVPTLHAPATPGPSMLVPDRHNRTPASTATDAQSYITAREIALSPDSIQQTSGDHISEDSAETVKPLSKPTSRTMNQYEASQSSPMTSQSELGSTTPLLRSSSRHKGKGRMTSAISTPEPETQEVESNENIGDERLRFHKRAIKYNDNFLDRRRRLRSKISRTHSMVSGTLSRRRKVKAGEIIKAERMLVRIEETEHEIPEDYDENDSWRMETRVADNWREFLVVLRATSDEDAPFTLQMYKTRVIPEIQRYNTKAKPYHEISLGRQKAKLNLYSSLDKTIVIWRPCKHGTKIYIIRPKSTAHAVEWYTSLGYALGRRRASSLSVNVPDLGVSLTFKNPFEQLEARLEANERSGMPALSGQHEAAAQIIIRGCFELLDKHPEWADVLHNWSKTERMGLAWKRYDRLEWVHGINEERMYGTLAMQRTHELELRPRQHYRTHVHNGNKKDEEPEPVEGFLIRLTSQRGVHQRMNKMFFKRLYCFTQDHYLFFCRPAKSLPPTPPRLCADDSNIPSTQEILNEMPLSYDIDPFPIRDGEITWLSSGNKEHIKRHDEEAFAQLRRNLHNLTSADGYIDICHVQEVRNVHRDSCPADPNIREGPGVEFNPETRDTRRDDGATQKFDDNKTFEMLLENGLVVRFQAYDEETKNEWMRTLDALVKYWKARCAADAAELKILRQRNVEILDIDEEMESVVGQFARKWEVRRAQASPLLHNMCAFSGCRAINMSGQLFRKPRRHSTFKRCNVILTDGKLLVFRNSLRKRNGVQIPHVHSNLEATIDLSDCYVYSGLLTDSDLLYTNQTFDSNRPSHRTLPRAYLSTDAYTSSDEDTAITFVIWQPLRKNLFRARELGEKGQTKQTLKQVSKLGVHGRTAVFKARSRVDKDRWVMSIASEIDRLQESKPEDVRVIATNI
ncbi:Pleckstrin homology domain-containing protein [Aspergillus bertholletiae]|uniref:Pleckstrin homology domain-containing protein n=1 Tax=Aspergillus bertholletiae TaxID=1226010 RepID=A0A5N7BGR6_9EURO|nr:Pleckstrin homology domain-containing protein [Aspergillus bertholletiae]